MTRQPPRATKQRGKTTYCASLGGYCTATPPVITARVAAGEAHRTAGVAAGATPPAAVFACTTAEPYCRARVLCWTHNIDHLSAVLPTNRYCTHTTGALLPSLPSTKCTAKTQAATAVSPGMVIKPAAAGLGADRRRRPRGAAQARGGARARKRRRRRALGRSRATVLFFLGSPPTAADRRAVPRRGVVLPPTPLPPPPPHPVPVRGE